MKDWYIYEYDGYLRIAATLQEIYKFFSGVCGITDEELASEKFCIVKVQSVNKPKLQNIKVTHTLKLV